MEYLLLSSFLCLVCTVNAFFQCPSCSERNDPASCTGVTDCDVNFDVCELTIYLKEQNRIEFTCSERASCAQAETRDCNPANQDKCVFCCNNLGTCQEQAYLVFSDFLSTTPRSTTTKKVETDPPTTTTSTTTSCASNAEKMSLVIWTPWGSLTPKICDVEYPYCYTTIVQTHTNKTIYKGCAEHDFCFSKYWQQTMQKPECLTGDYAGQQVDCSFCCTGTGCNAPDKPTDASLLQF